MAEELGSYIIRGGAEGKARLAVIARVLAPATQCLLDRLRPLAGATIVDAGCGGGEVSFVLAERAGEFGRVIGFDLDERKLALAREEAVERGLDNVEFRTASALEPWPVAGASLALMRLLLTHVAEPERVLAHAQAALAPGGMVALQDVDYRGRFCDPPSAAHDRYVALYEAASRQRGGDPHIGARLPRLLEDAGFAEVDAVIVHPFGNSADVKATASLTLDAIAGTLVEAGLASAAEIAQLSDELAAFAARPDVRMATPRIVQAWGCRPP